MVTIVAAFIFAYVATMLLGLHSDPFSGRPEKPILFLLIIFAVPYPIAFRAARWLTSRKFLQAPLPKLGQPLPRRAQKALVAAYLLTALLGIPAVQNHTTAWAIAEYKRVHQQSTEDHPGHPFVATYMAIPLAPGLILTYHEFSLASLYGFGGFQLFFWSVRDVTNLAIYPISQS